MTDPRMAYDSESTGTADVRYFVSLFDAADAAAGVVRVDTRDPATIERIAIAFHQETTDCAGGDCCTAADLAVASRLLAALTETV